MRHPAPQSLAGEWAFVLTPETDDLTEHSAMPASWTETVVLPGSLQAQGKGIAPNAHTRWTGRIRDPEWYTRPQYVRYGTDDNFKMPFWLTPQRTFVGEAWYQRQIEVPAEWEGQTIDFCFERAHWQTTLYVDGQPVGTENSLLTPHRYRVDSLAAGMHTLTLCVDNRLHVDVGINAHTVTDHTQTNWNGIIGSMTMKPMPARTIEDVQVYPDIRRREARVVVALGGESRHAARLTLEALTATGRRQGERVELALSEGSADTVEAVIAMGADAQLWSEYTPVCYRLRATLQSAEGRQTEERDFGLREFRSKGTRFEVNGEPVFLRGTLECCVFPLTGYPPMDAAPWVRIFETCRAHGLNHVRFHSWCPPEAAFHVADSMGFYLQVECGVWTHVGGGKATDAWIRAEGDRILREYGNHPSFCLLLHGNEPSGSKREEFLSELVSYWKQKDPRRVYSTGAGWPYVPEADFWHALPVRLQAWNGSTNSILNAEPPRTDYDWRDSIRTDMPTISHEIGQWCAYPNLKETSKYTGLLQARNFDIFRETLEERGLGALADSFLLASGRHQVLAYKADIEAALRTPGFAGFQLLGLSDFPGQGTALVGVLDAFWESKGYVTADEYRSFTGEVVPLARLPKMLFWNDEELSATLEFSNFSASDIVDAPIRWRITDRAGSVYREGTFTQTLPRGNGIEVGEIRCRFDGLARPTQLCLEVCVNGTDIHNGWNLWVYSRQDESPYADILVTSDFSEAQARLDAGGRVLYLNYGQIQPAQGGDIVVGFSPIFWSSVWTHHMPPHTLGICCDAAHPALADFPNEGFSDYQWWDLTAHCQAMNLDSLSMNLQPIVRIIDDPYENRSLALVAEARRAGGHLVVCSADLQSDLAHRPAAAQFRRSLLRYLAESSNTARNAE